MPSEISEPKPNLLTVKAMAPKAAIGETFIASPIIQNRPDAKLSMTVSMGLARSPAAARPKANSTEKNRICRMSPLAKPEIMVFGMMLSRNSLVDAKWRAVVIYESTELVLTPCMSIFMPAPGCSRLIVTRPSTRASVVTTSK